jgi:hypothetical protein
VSGPAARRRPAPGRAPLERRRDCRKRGPEKLQIGFCRGREEARRSRGVSGARAAAGFAKKEGREGAGAAGVPKSFP